MGGGISGLTFALEVADAGSVGVLFKKAVHESSTWYAQGGIAAVQSPEDSFELHLEDTLVAGAGLCDEEIARIVVEEGPVRVQELIERGAKFDREHETEEYDLHREGGHSRRRILHSADHTGREIQETLMRAAKLHPNIKFITDCSAVDLITERKIARLAGRPKAEMPKVDRVQGAYILDSDREVKTISANQVLIATGGSGKVYLYTSNPDVATGDGIAMCYRAGVEVANMEFFQFHPTCLYHPKAKSFLITEAMRGEGAILKRLDGSAFMKEHDARAELAPRDIVARAIDFEMKASGDDHVLLDISHKPAAEIKESFPTIYDFCLKLGIDITTEPIPVVPAAHYCCGGVLTDSDGATSIKNLFVCGESAYTGLHGANRLASNSLVEGLVFSARAAKRALVEFENDSSKQTDLPAWDVGSATDSEEEVVITQNWDEIRHFMWNFVGIVRSDKRLERAARRSSLIEQEIQDYYWNFKLTSDLLELRNLSLVASLVIKSALLRKESRGLHYNVDYPEASNDYLKPTLLKPKP